MDNGLDARAFTLEGDALAEAIEGAAFLERSADGIAPCHLPEWARRRSGSSHFEVLARATTGVSIGFRTRSSHIAMNAIFTRYAFLGKVDDVVVTLSSGPLRRTVEVPADAGVIVSDSGEVHGGVSVIRFELEDSDVERDVVIHLPQGAATTVVDVRANHPFTPLIRGGGPLWLHHGSSISHGADLPDPESPWPIRAARALGARVIDASFSGNCLLDPFVADALSEREIDVLTIEVGINIVNWDSHIERTFVPALHGFLDRFRTRHPDLPILVITPLYCSFHENVGGPIDIDPDGNFRASDTQRLGALTLTDIRRLVADVVSARGDELISILDGRILLGEDDADLLIDRLHPGEEGTQVIADRFVDSVRDRRDAVGLALA